MKKLKKFLKLGTLIGITTVAACTAEKKYKELVDEKFAVRPVTEEDVSKIQYHKSSPQKTPSKLDNQRN